MWALRRAFDVPGALFQIPAPTAIVRSVQKLFDEGKGGRKWFVGLYFRSLLVRSRDQGSRSPSQERPGCLQVMTRCARSESRSLLLLF